MEKYKDISLGLLMVGATFVALVSFFVEWKYYRSPHYHKCLDTRMKIDETTYCPKCGKIILSKIDRK